MNKFTAPLISTALALAPVAVAMAKIPPLKLDVEDITVSGLSAGGYMANQMHIAYSDWISGVGIIAAGPYYCAKGDITTALSQCVDKEEPAINLDELSAVAEQQAQQNTIAPLANLKNDKVWLFHGTRDTRVSASATNKLAQQYARWVSAENIKYVNDKPIAHLFPTLNHGGQCMVSEAPFIGRCDYDAAGDMLSFLLDDIKPASTKTSGRVISYSQKSLAGSDAKTLADTGYAYVPKQCEEGETCHVHVSFHGCNQYAEAVDMAYVEQTGLNNWADSNNLVVVYPQTRKSLFMPLNPQGCWDWWGYTGDDYATREGKQLKAVRKIVLGLASN
ncbi:PHB depolymerase family esterase [Alteromonas sp. C1M14]|uniref:extracellular catalytic domain type 2 short-chain-length polyhydroxyalkanoate depolymerase n=1 Tax=Alteromonas sp. C1M14 TaxID=2841567 RepID=UPI001C0A52B2|nr:PHB depolymerase family esterase [Alteromonas sp. C1M14]MBU2978840.1 prolyl oligopeptidase family serine peptidase [Alteromonas sp. C1M14]